MTQEMLPLLLVAVMGTSVLRWASAERLSHDNLLRFEGVLGLSREQEQEQEQEQEKKQ